MELRSGKGYDTSRIRHAPPIKIEYVLLFTITELLYTIFRLT